MKEQLTHILDQSVCLSRKQMKEYLSGTMQQEEMHAAEVHLSACPLCSMAMEGFEAHSDEALAAIASLNSGFLKEHFDNIAPQIHLNSMAPAAAMPAAKPSGKIIAFQPWWRKASIAAAILLAFGALWYLEFGRNEESVSGRIADNTSFQAQAPTEDAVAEKAIPALAATEEPSTQSDAPDVPPGKDIPPAAEAVNSTVQSAPSKENEIARPIAAADRTIAKREEAVAALAMNSAEPKSSLPAPESRNLRRSMAVESVAALPAESSDDSRSGSAPASKRLQEDVSVKPAAKAAPLADRSSMELGQESYDKGKYAAALSHYRRHILSGAPGDRAQAKLMAARCYRALGNTSKATALLQSVEEEGNGPQRRAARRLLRELEVPSISR